MAERLILTAMTVLGALSPLLTFLALFQIKEWRLDRLREHLRHEGIFTLWGRIRPLLLGVTLVLTGLTRLDAILHAGLGLFALLGIVQIALKKQRLPTWTRKAQILAVLSTLFLAAVFLAVAFAAPRLLPLAALVHPLVALLAWVSFLPIDTRMKRRIFAAAERVRDRQHDRRVIGIVGSVGKTTTKNLISHLLADIHPLATPEHVNTEMGVAQWMLARVGSEKDPGGPLVIEMGAYAKGEIALLCTFAKPDIAVITALGSDHLALFGSEEAIMQANGEILASLPAESEAFIQVDTDGGRTLAHRASCPTTRIGSDPSAHEYAEELREDDSGLSFKNRGTQFTVALHGRHMVNNVLTAIAVARALGIPEARIAELLAAFRPRGNTFALRTENGVVVLDDTYNASRLSLLAAIDWARERAERPRVLLTAGLLELGAQESEILREAGHSARGVFERVIFTTNSGRRAFAEGFGKEVEIALSSTAHVSSGSLLVCVGRMSASGIRHLIS
jgi:UDP-N-acetylmuramoyl-tripeptide--D-alanyl-D-alanine ligase